MDRVAPATHLVRAGRLAVRFFVIASLRSDPVDVWSFSPLLANPIARPSPLFSWIASLSLAMTVDDWVSYCLQAFHNLASPVMELACALCV